MHRAILWLQAMLGHEVRHADAGPLVNVRASMRVPTSLSAGEAWALVRASGAEERMHENVER